MKNTRKENLWYNPSEKEFHSLMQEGGEALGMRVERMVQTEAGRSLLASYCRIYSSKR